MARRSVILKTLTFALSLLAVGCYLILFGFTFRLKRNAIMRYNARNIVPVNPTSVDFWVTQHLCWHDKNRGQPNTRKVVFRTIGAGLGDQVFALLAVYSYAVLTRRELQIDWNEPYPVGIILSARAKSRFLYRKEKDPKVQWRYSYTDQLPDHIRNLLVSNQKTVILKMGPGPWADTICDDLRGDLWNGVDIPPFDNSAIRAALHILLDPSPELRHAIAKTRKTLRLPRRYIAVQARLGQGTNEAKKYKRFTVLQGKHEAIARCFAQAVKRYAWNERPVVFFATDTAEWRSLFEIEMGRAMPWARVEYLDQTPMHWRKNADRELFIMQHVTTRLIGDAEQTIALNSGFSKIGFWRGQGNAYTTLKFDACLKGSVQVQKSENILSAR